jgi:hypothetical protein
LAEKTARMALTDATRQWSRARSWDKERTDGKAGKRISG